MEHIGASTKASPIKQEEQHPAGALTENTARTGGYNTTVAPQPIFAVDKRKGERANSLKR